MILINRQQKLCIAFFSLLLPLIFCLGAWCQYGSGFIDWDSVCEEKRRLLTTILRDGSVSDSDKADSIIKFGQNVPEQYKKTFWNRSLAELAKELLSRQINRDMFFLPKSEPDLRFFEVMAQLEQVLDAYEFNNDYGLIWNSMAFHWRLYHLLQSPDNTKTYRHYFATRFYYSSHDLEKGEFDSRLRQFLLELHSTLKETKNKNAIDFTLAKNVAKGCLISIFETDRTKTNLGNIPEKTEEAFKNLFDFAKQENDTVLHFLVQGLYFRRALHSSASLNSQIWSDFERLYEEVTGPQKYELERRVYRPNNQMWAANRGVLSFFNSLIPPPPKQWYEYRTFVFILIGVTLITWVILCAKSVRKTEGELGRVLEVLPIEAGFRRIETEPVRQISSTKAQPVTQPDPVVPADSDTVNINMLDIGAMTSVFSVKGPGVKPVHVRLNYFSGDWFYTCLNGETKDENRQPVKNDQAVKITTNTSLYLGLSETELKLNKTSQKTLQISFKSTKLLLNPVEDRP